MLKLYINDGLVDLPPDVAITIKRSNPAYMGEDVNVIKSTFSFPFTLPLSPRNREILGFPDRLDNAATLPENMPAYLVAGAGTLLKGLVTVQAATRTTAKVFLYNNPLADLAKQYIDDTDQGVFQASSEADLATRMKFTAENPLEQDFIFCPVYNLALRDDDEFIPPVSDFMNSWNYDGQRFITAFHVAPFLRVAPMLRKAIEAGGFTFTDGFHVTPELQRQILITNRSLRFETALSLRIPLKMCLPKTSITDFLKSLCRTYCLAPFTNLNGTHIDLSPLGPLVNGPIARDWSAYTEDDYERQSAGANVARYEWGEEAHTLTYFFSTWSQDHPVPVLTVADFVNESNQIIQIPNNQVYYFHGRSAVSIPKRIPFLFGREFQNSFGYIENPGGGETVSPSLLPAQTHIVYSFPSDFDQIVLPTVSMQVVGIETAPFEVPVAFGEITSQTGEIVGQLSFYRGMRTTRNGQRFPMSNHAPSNAFFRKLPEDNVSLNWLGPNGLYEQWWKEWDGMLRRASVVKRRFLLPLTELIAFDFRDKVRAGNRNYFVRDMEFTVSAKGVSPTTCTLVTVS
jgi:hypothetical protein